jgi:hypothetical protein
MAWYVFALVEEVPSRSPGKGLAAAITFRPAAGFFAAVERRADVPPVELGALQAHQRIVERMASHAPSILPVRFGTLLTAEEIDESLDERESELEEAFALVRRRSQMTWRARTTRSAERPTPPTRPTARPITGAEYLERAARATKPPATGMFRRIDNGPGSLAAAKRYQPRSASLPEALYHLVDRSRLDAYVDAARPLQAPAARVTLSGPWAPYAFVPELF